MHSNRNADSEVEAARRAFDRNKQRVLSGESFRATPRANWGRGKSPSSYTKRHR